MTNFAPPSDLDIGLLVQSMQVMDAFSAPIIWLHETGQVLDVNQCFAEKYQQEKSFFKHKQIFDLAPKLSTQEWTHFWQQLCWFKQANLKLELPDISENTNVFQLRGMVAETSGQVVCCAFCENGLPIQHQMAQQLNKIGTWQWNLETREIEISAFTSALVEIELPNQKCDADDLREILKERLFSKEYAFLRTQLKQFFKQGTPVDVEFSMYMPSSGHEKRFRLMAVAIEGSPQIWGTVQDISDIIHRTEEMYLTQYALNNVREMVYWVEPNGTLQYVNTQMSMMLGYSPEELRGMKFWDLRTDFNEPRWQYKWEEFRKGKVLELEVNFKSKNDEIIPIHITGYYLKYRGKEIACIFGKDLRPEKRREEILRLTRYSLNNMQEMTYWIRLDGSFYYFNDAFAIKLGYTREEVQRMKMLDFFPNFNEAAFQAGWERLRNGEILSSELEITHRNGFHIPVQTYITLINVEGEPCACGILTDISERKRKQEELNNAFEAIKTLQEQFAVDNKILKEEIASEYQFNNIISTSPRYKKVLKQVEQAAQTDATVLLTGEIGTGKELLAHALHQLSRRADRPMVKINYSTIPEYLLESELFGHEKEAFPGAFRQKKGRFELANGGTVFFNEIGNLPLRLQEKLLHLLQDGKLVRMGGTEVIPVDIRVVAASNRNLEELVMQGALRSDLYYRLGLITIYNLPLRERREDIPLLIQHFVDKFTRKIGKRIDKIPTKLIEILKEYHFPGNIRELENMIERAVILSEDNTLQAEHLSFASTSGVKPIKSLEEAQRDHILEALKRTNGQITGDNGAAKLLGLNDQTLYSKMKKLKITRQDYQW